MIDVGFNWHINQYVKFYFDWAHSMFNNPVLYSQGHRQLTRRIISWLKIQLYF